MSLIRRLLDRVFGAATPPLAAAMEMPPSARLPVEGDVDLVVRDAFFPGRTGTIIEVGAARPDYLSISASFRATGWRALAIEPNPAFAALHRAAGADVLEVACGEADRDDVPFFVVESSSTYLGEAVSNESFSSLGVRGKFADLIETVDVTKREIRVSVRRLDGILAERGMDQSEVDILSVDVEGWELEVLAGLTPGKPGPRVLIIENNFAEAAQVAAIEAKGYRLWKKLPPNDVFVRVDVAIPA